MLRDLLICIFASLNILIFSFLGIHEEALRILLQEPPAKILSISAESILQMQHALQGLPKRISSSSPSLEIPIIAVRAPLLEGTSPQDISKMLTRGALTLSPFLPPPEKGRTVIFAHSSDYPWKENPYATLFMRLPNLHIGDKIIVHHDEKKYSYQITKTLITDASLSPLLSEKNTENQIVLSTCYPVGLFNKRYSVIANAL